MNQAALFGTAFIGLLLFRAGGAEAVLGGICVLYIAALAILAIVPELGHEPTRTRSCASAWRAGSPR